MLPGLTFKASTRPPSLIHGHSLPNISTTNPIGLRIFKHQDVRIQGRLESQTESPCPDSQDQMEIRGAAPRLHCIWRAGCPTGRSWRTSNEHQVQLSRAVTPLTHSYADGISPELPPQGGLPLLSLLIAHSKAHPFVSEAGGRGLPGPAVCKAFLCRVQACTRVPAHWRPAGLLPTPSRFPTLAIPLIFPSSSLRSPTLCSFSGRAWG